MLKNQNLLFSVEKVVLEKQHAPLPQPYTSQKKVPERTGLYMAILIVIDLVFTAAYLTSVAGTAQYTLLFTNFLLFSMFWGGFIGLGLIIPLIVYLLAKLRLGIPLSVWILILYLCFILIAVGNIAGRYALLAAGQLF